MAVPIHANAATNTGLENGELCMTSSQCKSGACGRSSGLELARCVPKAVVGEACTAKELTGTYYKPPCEQNLTCTVEDGATDTTFGVCTVNMSLLDNGQVCQASVQCKSKACVQKEDETVAHCTPKAAVGETCSPKSLYGIYKNPPCERGLFCYTGETEFGTCIEMCRAGYYMSGSDCIRCPIIDTTTYGNTPDYNTGGIETCYAATGEYTDSTGDFTFSAQCNYTK